MATSSASASSADLVASEALVSPVASPTESPSPSAASAAPALLGASPPGSNRVCDTGWQSACGSIGASGGGTVMQLRRCFVSREAPNVCSLPDVDVFPGNYMVKAMTPATCIATRMAGSALCPIKTHRMPLY